MDQDFVKLAEAIGNVNEFGETQLSNFIKGWARGDKKFNCLFDYNCQSGQSYQEFVKYTLAKLTTPRSRKDILNEATHLREVVSKLGEEHITSINLGELGEMEIISLSWQDGVKYQEVDMFMERTFWDKFREFVDGPKLNAIREEFQKRIDNVIEEANALADELGEDRENFFCEHCLP